MVKMVSGEHKTITVTNKVFLELVRIKYARQFENYSEVIQDLLDDDAIKPSEYEDEL